MPSMAHITEISGSQNPQTPEGMFFDEVSKIRVLEVDKFSETTELRDECKEFVEKIMKFQTIVNGFIEMVEGLSNQVEQEKIKAIGTRNHLKSMSKNREVQQLQLQSLIAEKKTQLERYRLQHESLLKHQQEQEEFIES